MWSSQHYIDQGIAQGRDPELLDRAVSQIEALSFQTARLPAVLTLMHLSQRTRVDYAYLRNVVAGSREKYYKFFRIRKKSGGRRLISVPDYDLLRAQRWISYHILRKLHIHCSSYAFHPGSSTVLCASRHCGARWLIKMDVKGFFGSISELQVYNAFRSQSYEPLIAFELARLATHSLTKSSRYGKVHWRAWNDERQIKSYTHEHIGFLPQGAATSPMLSNIVMFEIDGRISRIARNWGLRYTRYSDDLTFSTRKDFSRDSAQKFIQDVTELLRSIDLQVNDKKTKVVPPGGRKLVLGLLVDGNRPQLTKTFRDNLRGHLYFAEKYGPEQHATKRGFSSVWGFYRHLQGLINYCNMVDKERARRYYEQFNRLQWPRVS